MLLFVVSQVFYIVRYFLKYYSESVKLVTYKRMAYTDMMTLIGNRASFQKELDYLDSNKTNFSSIWCILMDLNNLKKVNDNLGHTSGDDLIINFAKILKNVSEEKGNCYRTGGDEFILIFKNTTQNDIENILKDINLKIELFNLKNDLKISVAIGYDNFKFATDKNISQLISRTDKLMYENKQSVKASKTPPS